ncbi:MAG: hypothetical protein ABSG25_05200 [Bryobacteraceae bacterium]
MSFRKLVPVLSLSLTLAASAASQHRPVSEAGSVQELQLQQIQSESDDAKKTAMLEQFAARNPKHPALPWVYEQMIETYSNMAQFDKVLRTCDPLLTIDPNDVAAAQSCLKAAEAKKDTEAILKFSGLAWTAAHKAITPPAPAGQSAEISPEDVEFARGVQLYSEYSVFLLAYQATDMKTKLKFTDILEQRNPDSTYVVQLTQQRFTAYIKTGDQAKAIALAEHAIAANPNNEDMLLAIESGYLETKRFDKAIELASKTIGLLSSKAKPESMSDADWQAHKAQTAGRALWVRGIAYAEQEKWPAANQDLREALPAIRDNQEMLAEALFYLGAANLGMAVEDDMVEFAQEGLKFSQQCAEIPSRFQNDASRNVRAIKEKYNLH